MDYFKARPYIHVLLQPLERKKTEVEVVMLAGGSLQEAPQDRGRKHLMEHCIASRARGMSYREYKDFLFKNNIQSNATTGRSMMSVEYSGHCSDMELMVDLALETVFHPTFDQTDLDREREVVLREISERRGDPGYRLFFDTMDQTFTADSTYTHQVLGSAEQVAKTTVEDMARLHRQSLAQSHIVVMVYGGGIEKEKISALIEKHLAIEDGYTQALAESSERYEPNHGYTNEFLPFTKKGIFHELAHEHVESMMFLPLEYTFENQPVFYIYRYLFLLYGGALYDRIRDELGYVYSLQSYYLDDLNCLELNVSSEEVYVEKIVDEVHNVLGDFSNNFKMDKFNDFKSLIHKKIEMANDALGADVRFVKNQMSLWNTPESYSEFAGRVSQVTPEDLERVYNIVAGNLGKMKVLATSKNQSIKTIFNS